MGRVVVACAPFMGTLSASRATGLVADQLRHRGFDVDERPLPDGGEGTADVLAEAWGLTESLSWCARSSVNRPMPRPGSTSRFGWPTTSPPPTALVSRGT